MIYKDENTIRIISNCFANLAMELRSLDLTGLKIIRAGPTLEKSIDYDTNEAVYEFYIRFNPISPLAKKFAKRHSK